MLTVCVNLLLQDTNYNTGQNIWDNVKKSSENGHDIAFSITFDQRKTGRYTMSSTNSVIF